MSYQTVSKNDYHLNFRILPSMYIFYNSFHSRYIGSRNSNSPNGSENAYAEANLLTASNRFSGGGNDHDYDSDLYANGDPISVASSSNYHSR